LNPDEYRKMFELENTYWYFQGRRSIISGLLRQNLPVESKPLRILDVGCGTGLMLEHLREMGQSPVGFDLHPLAMRYCQQRGLQRLVRGDVTRLPFGDSCFDLILALDLMEHVEDDRALLREFRRVAVPGALILLTVPAHPFLWSEHDESLRHYRRYRREPLRRLLAEAGFRPLRFGYCISFLFPAIVIFRLIRRRALRPGQPQTHLIELPRWLNALLIGLLRIEGLFLRRFTFPMGVTLLAMLAPNAQRRKPADAPRNE